MKEEELKEIINKDIKEEPELENIGKMFLGFIDIYNKDIKEAELKGRQSKLKEVLKIIEKINVKMLLDDFTPEELLIIQTVFMKILKELAVVKE